MTLRLLLLSASLLASPAFAQDAAPALTAEDVAAMRSEIKALRDEVSALKTAQAKAAIPSWKGAPQLEDKKEGWSFKPRGRVQLDTGAISTPGAFTGTRSFGTATRVRRMRLGAEGTIPGGFGYKFDVDFANSAVGFGDVYLSYDNKAKGIGVKLGNHESLNGLEQITSSNYVTFTERAQMNEAFSNTRRLGVSAGWHDKDDVIRLDAGLFTAHSIDSSVDNDGWIAAGRVVFAPQLGKGRVHIGGNFQHREFQSNNAGTASTSVGAPSTNQLARYRARPFTQLTDVRFVDTGSFAAHGDTIMGVELAGLFGPLYFASEAQWTKVDAYAAGDVTSGIDVFNSTNSAVVPTGNPGFFGGYAEVGYFLTGETRGYKEGTWGRTKVKKPLGKGGWGALQIAARIDHLDLDSSKLKNGLTNNFNSGTTTLAGTGTRLGRGGKQTGYLFGLNWYPADYVRFMFNYAHVDVDGGPLAAIVRPASTAPVDQRSFGVDLVALRAQVDF